jgi:hypothetical protein
VLSNLKIPKELRKKIDNELQLGEGIRWVEQPVPRFFTVSSIGIFLFGIYWTSFALVWMHGASRFDPGFASFGLFFVLIGFGMLSSPIWEWQKVRKTVYLVTDKRAISIQGGWSTTIRSYLPNQL